tara:strand:- start:1074 stop:1664 length:591 start_codon:yes stop_codon:yes gene_type:complete
MESLKIHSNKGNIIEDIFLLTPNLFNDERGYFYESWNNNILNKIVGKEILFIQENISFSKKNVLRGMHYQISPKAQTKFVRCTKGEVFDVVIDLRYESPTFGEWASAYLSEDNKNQLFIPKGFAHGFLTLSENAEFTYLIDENWSPLDEKSILWNDKDLDINWPLNSADSSSLLISEKDKKAFSLRKAVEKGYIFK